ncbi:MAG: outer membrane beta-barrel protein [Pseudomonadales bacterium]
MTTFRMAPIGLMIGALLYTSAAMAKDDGFYIGASVGAASFQEKVDIDFEDIDDFDESDFAFKIFGGYQFNGLFALEGGYVDFGKPSNSDIEVDAYGLDAFAVVGIPLGPIRGFAKGGGIYWDAEATLFDEFEADDDGFDFAAGVGLELELFGLGVRGEVEYFDIADEVWMYTLGATFTF